MPRAVNEGEQLALDGTEAVLAADVSVLSAGFREHAERALAELIRAQVEFTAEDVRDRIPPGVEAHHPNVLPAVIRLAAQRRQIEPVGWKQAERPTRHASVNRIWRAA